jgi:ferredoxin-type protein NapH
MNIYTARWYNGPFKIGAPLFILSVAVGGYFYPLIGLVIPGMMLLALMLNARSRRLFCSQLCPNGRTYSVAMPKYSKNRSMPRLLKDPGLRKVLCAFMFFCVINLLVRSGGGMDQVGRVFWGIYLMATGLGFAFGASYKPRSWCVVCPMGTLQDTLRPGIQKSGR